jgi:hypothetical protein
MAQASRSSDAFNLRSGDFELVALASWREGGRHIFSQSTQSSQRKPPHTCRGGRMTTKVTGRFIRLMKFFQNVDISIEVRIFDQPFERRWP